MTQEAMGPTVIEYAEARIRRINQIIADLNDEREMLKARMFRYGTSSKMLESERRATESEPYQATQLPEE